MNKKLLTLSLAAILAAPCAFAVGSNTPNNTANTGTDDDPDDKQTVNITVPKVALLNIEDTGLTIDKIVLALTAPDDAGRGFAAVESATQAVKVSSNSAKGSSTTQKVTVKLGAALPATWQLDIIPAGIAADTTDSTAGGNAIATSAATVSCTLATCNSDQDLIIDIDNELINAGSIKYRFGPVDANGMAAYTSTAQDVTVTYTLSST
ncbi:hypothetical protein [Thiothrix unzii]|jgi:hypothetical protein|uniref:hypothetical protein n=1 Tax=Thiothrix unzii TaxID=111769 RepID=UPI002A360BE2|nr:hypothetical protein [Thiothrix unzii]MDX9989558.1 hypothetical protein [Thiothrix unzii]